MIRILVFGLTENPGGVERFLATYYRHINREKIQFDFLCNTYETVAYEKELAALGARFFHITARSKDREKYHQQLEALFRMCAHEWSAVWVNVCSLANIDYLKVAKRFGIEKRIIHSHNSRNMDSWLRGLLHQWNRREIGKYATDFWACSEDAARWFYDDQLMGKAVIIHNAIEIDRMRFDWEKRQRLRDAYGWNHLYVIGNVGRLHFQKNQDFMIEVFKKYHRIHPDSILVLVGQGEDEKKLKEKAALYGLKESIFFAGVQQDIQAWLSSFDLFLLPSKFEGLSIAALEAQINGLPVLASYGVIPKEVKMNRNFIFYDLDEGASAWAAKIDRMREMNREPDKIVRKIFAANGYDISKEVKKLEGLLTDGNEQIPGC